MPIPESKDFLARKPKVPPTFDGVDYSDTKALKAAQDAILREQWISTMENRILNEELGKCYYKEGINHLANCSALREEYIRSLKHAKVTGYLYEMKTSGLSKEQTTAGRRRQ